MLSVAAAALVLALNVAAWRHRHWEHGLLLRFGSLLPWAAVSRWPGAQVGRRLGHSGVHALAWFTAVLGSAMVTLVMSCLVGLGLRPSGFPAELARALLLAMFAATLVEGCAMSHQLRPANDTGER